MVQEDAILTIDRKGKTYCTHLLLDDRELALNIRRGHDTCVVDKNVYRYAQVVDRLRCRFDAVWYSQV